LLYQEADNDHINSRGMYVLVDLGPLVGVVEVVSIHSMLHDQVKQAKRGNQGANDSIGNTECKYQQHPTVIESEREFVQI
jgi:hypothetical protein